MANSLVYALEVAHPAGSAAHPEPVLRACPRGTPAGFLSLCSKVTEGPDSGPAPSRPLPLLPQGVAAVPLRAQLRRPPPGSAGAPPPGQCVPSPSPLGDTGLELVMGESGS